MVIASYSRGGQCALIAGWVMKIRRDQKRDVRRLAGQAVNIVFDQPIGVCHPFPQMLGLEPGFDEERFQKDALLRHILEDPPSIGSVPTPLLPDLFDRRQELRGIVAMTRYRTVTRTGPFLSSTSSPAWELANASKAKDRPRRPMKFPAPSEGNCEDCARCGEEMGNRQTVVRPQYAPKSRCRRSPIRK